MLIAMWYAISVLAGPQLMISACVEDSAGKHISVYDWDEVRLVLEGGMVPDYVNLFPPMFYRSFHVYLWHYNMFLCLCFLKFLFGHVNI